jgi:hypothetical protein
MMKIKKILLSLLIFIVNLNFINGENILLKDGSLIKGQLVSLNKSRISIMINNQVTEYGIDQIEYLIAQVSQDKYSTIFVRKTSGTMLKVNLIKLTQTALYYKNINDDELRLLKLSSISEISLENTTISKAMKENVYESDPDRIDNINDDINKLIEQLSKRRPAEDVQSAKNQDIKSEMISIDNADFYEKFWSKINKYLDMNTENLLWNLLEDYSDKEKSLNLVYNEGFQDKSKKDPGIKDKIIKLRNDFYKRAKKILLSR